MKIKRLHVLLLLLIGSVVALVLQRTFWPTESDEATYSLIEDGLYMGGSVKKPPPDTRAVLNLCEQEDRYRSEVHRWEPIVDAEPAPDLDWLRRMVEFVDEQRRAGHTTYVHCFAGISRSGMVVAAYLMFKHRWTRDKALAFMRSKRPEVRPNPAFMPLLLEWERHLFDPPPPMKGE